MKNNLLEWEYTAYAPNPIPYQPTGKYHCKEGYVVEATGLNFLIYNDEFVKFHYERDLLSDAKELCQTHYDRLNIDI